MRLLGVDPGESVGWCLIDYTREFGIVPVLTGTYKREEFYKNLNENLIPQTNFIVCEDFAVRPNYARSGAFDWDRLPACKVIGALEYVTANSAIPMLLQSASVKPMGYGFLGKEYRKGAKNVHHLDAQAHVVYYLVTRLKATPPSMKALRAEKQTNGPIHIRPITQKSPPTI